MTNDEFRAGFFCFRHSSFVLRHLNSVVSPSSTHPTNRIDPGWVGYIFYCAERPREWLLVIVIWPVVPSSVTVHV
jgi:hypothetical protein